MIHFHEGFLGCPLADSVRYAHQALHYNQFIIVFHTITKTCLFKYTENFTPKNENFQMKNSDIFQMKISDIFHISALNIDCGDSLEPPRRGGSNEYQ